MVTLDTNEKIIGRVRRHWFVMLRATLGTFLLALLPIALWWGLGYINWDQKFSTYIKELMLFFYFIYLIFLWIFYFVEWTDYYLDMWLITDKRIIDIEQRGLFRREIISLRYDRIQDVTVVTNGIIQTLLGFGKIHLQTAGERRKIILKDAPAPEEVKRMILKEVRDDRNPTDM